MSSSPTSTRTTRAGRARSPRSPGPRWWPTPWRRPSYGARCRARRPCSRTGSARCTRTPSGGFDRPAQVTEVSGGDVLDFGGGALVVHVPGHTDGSIALLLPSHGVLFTGDAVAASPVDGGVMLGVFNVDRDRAVDSFRRLADLDAEVACFGHGDPVIRRAAEALREAARAHGATG
ncbi:MBL fold metallo-hydrolase [Streptomyces sp. DSM 40712]|uniref:MBL fold metallo-hydrolase n=1 Tax=Streptomyces lancefieldiae TaxID=3075520 RepID=A0ABU3AK16_9ACTN|nr:MBL fold metallo-hydrolase [Streptomyces sp. DSM 40712]MDT0610523.1 MBL fold metallo-hydrolase [Streptomyces sp. DSM 40712]